ncbi:hypothetical protein PROPEN_01696 [Proteus penneri ATCC 35198]|nr:hypothetical protein PROPEN_01696 [Proteus penneri ATCC 35198]
MVEAIKDSFFILFTTYFYNTIRLCLQFIRTIIKVIKEKATDTLNNPLLFPVA